MSSVSLFPSSSIRGKFQLKVTEAFSEWLSELRDEAVSATIFTHLENFRHGNFKSSQILKSGVDELHELRVNISKAYHVYHSRKGSEVLILWGGTASTREEDIEKALKLKSEVGY